MAKSKTISSKYPPPFSRLRYDSHFDKYDTTAAHRGRKVVISIQVSDESELDQAVSFGVEVWKDWSRVFQLFLNATTNLLDTINDRIDQTLESDPSAKNKLMLQTKSSFRKNLGIKTHIVIFVDDDQKYFQVYSFHKTWGDHSIQATFNKNKKVEDAEVVNLY